MFVDEDQFRAELQKKGMSYLKQLESRFEEYLKKGERIKSELIMDRYYGAEAMLQCLELFDFDVCPVDPYLEMQRRLGESYASPTVWEEGSE